MSHPSIIELFATGATITAKDGRTWAGFSVAFEHEYQTHDDTGPVPGKQTKQRAELFAIYVALYKTRLLRNHLDISTDSEYCVNCFKRWVPAWRRHRWTNVRGDPIRNLDLIRPIDDLLMERPGSTDISFVPNFEMRHEAPRTTKEKDKQQDSAATDAAEKHGLKCGSTPSATCTHHDPTYIAGTVSTIPGPGTSTASCRPRRARFFAS